LAHPPGSLELGVVYYYGLFGRSIMYLRPIRHEELVAWLLENSFAEELPGYGHVDADELARELIKKFEILHYSNQAV
jgi:hypothetical protein